MMDVNFPACFGPLAVPRHKSKHLERALALSGSRTLHIRTAAPEAAGERTAQATGEYLKAPVGCPAAGRIEPAAVRAAAPQWPQIDVVVALAQDFQQRSRLDGVHAADPRSVGRRAPQRWQPCAKADLAHRNHEPAKSSHSIDSTSARTAPGYRYRDIKPHGGVRDYVKLRYANSRNSSPAMSEAGSENRDTGFPAVQCQQTGEPS
jgi:hypothetical protein